MEAQREQNMCLSHKSQLSFVCLNLKCQLARHLCPKCAVYHSSHKNDLIEIDNLVENKFDKLSAAQESNHPFIKQLQSLIFIQSQPVFKIFKFLNTLESIKSRIDGAIKYLKDKYLNYLNISESIFNPKPIFDSLKSTEYSSMPIDSYLKKIMQLNDRIQIENLVYQLDSSKLEQNIDILKQNIQELAINIQKFSKNNQVNQSFNLNRSEILKEAPNIKEQPKQLKQVPQNNNQTNNSTFEYNQYKIDFIINKNNNFQNLMEPLFNKKYDFPKISQLIDRQNMYQLEFDGCSKGNPGLSGVGFLIKEKQSKKLIHEFAVNVGNRTNNQSEYLGVIYGLYVGYKIGITKIFVQGDSQLVINQILGTYKVKSDNIKIYHELCNSFKQLFEKIELNHVKREFNSHADKLSNDALDRFYQ